MDVNIWLDTKSIQLLGIVRQKRGGAVRLQNLKPDRGIRVEWLWRYFIKWLGNNFENGVISLESTPPRSRLHTQVPQHNCLILRALSATDPSNPLKLMITKTITLSYHLKNRHNLEEFIAVFYKVFKHFFSVDVSVFQHSCRQIFHFWTQNSLFYKYCALKKK